VTALRRFSQVLGLMALSAGCSQVLGIEDAHLDAELAMGGGGTAQGGTSLVAGSTSEVAGDTHVHGNGGSAGGNGTDKAGSTNVADAGEDTGQGGAPAEASACESYCDAVMTNCKGKYEQYRTFDQCVRVCKHIPEGTAGDENVNSVQCRIRQASFAESEPFVYCKSAGPLGAGKCGSNCVAYCSQACLAACGAIPAHEDDPIQYSSSVTASPSCFVGNTVYCRMYHVAAGIEQDSPDEHCPHAMGGDPCNEP